MSPWPFLLLLPTLSTFALTPSPLEAYIFASNRTDMSSFFLPGSPDFLYFSLLRLIDAGQIASPEYQSMRSAFDSQGDATRVSRVDLRTLLKRWELTLGPVERKAILEEINRKYFMCDISGGIRSSQTGSGAGQTFPSDLPTLDTSLPSTAYTDYWTFYSLKPAALELLDVSRLGDQVLPQYLERAEICAAEKVAERVSEYLKLYHVSGVAGAFRKMTVQQLERLGELRVSLKSESSWLTSLLSKKHPVDTDLSYASLQLQLEQALTTVQTLATSPGLEKELLFRLLLVGLSTGQHQEVHFKRYLELRRQNRSFWSPYFTPIDQKLDNPGDWELIQEYSSLYFLNHPQAHTVYSSLLESSQLTYLIARANILGGAAPSLYSLPAADLNALAVLTELEFERSNPQSFAALDPVSLKIRRKNVTKLTISLIEFSAEAYYRRNLQAIPQDLSLDGVVAKVEMTRDCTDSPFLRTTETLDLPELQGQTGLFIVEITGAGLSARVWVKKGSLRLTSTSVPTGLQVQIYTETGQIAANSGLIIDGKRYSAVGQDPVLLPFAQTQSTKPVVLVGAGRAELLPAFLHESEDYSVKIAVSVQQEGLISGHRAQVGVAAKAYVNGAEMALERLEKVQIRAVMTDITGLLTSQVFPSPSLSSPLELDLPEGLRTLTIELSAQIYHSNSAKYQEISASSTVEANDPSYAPATFDLYFQSQVDQRTLEHGYIVKVLGKNGETVPNVIVDIVLETIYSSYTLQSTLQSDETGTIRLGSLKEVATVRANARGNLPVARVWTTMTQQYQVSYPAHLYLLDTETLDLPVIEGGVRPQAGLVTLAGSGEVRDYAVLSSGKGGVSVGALQEGKYMVRLPGKLGMEQVRVTVLKGKRVEKGLISSEKGLFPDTTALIPLGITSLTVQTASVTLTVSGSTAGAQVLLLLRHFQDQSPFSRFLQYRSLAPRLPSVFPAAPTLSTYLRSRLLDDETRYILDRKTASDKVGVGYPLPSLLLRPQLVNETNTEVQTPQPGTPYAPPSPAPAPVSDDSSHNDMSESVSSPGLYYDFLSEAGVVVEERTCDATGQVVIPVAAIGRYALAEVLIRTKSSISQRLFALSGSALGLKSQTLPVSLSGSQPHAEIRRISTLRPNDRIRLHDISTSSFAIIDSVGKLLSVLLQLGQAASSIPAKAGEWLFLGSWMEYKAEEKERIYSEKAGNELNLFLYYKDPVFFTTVVRPFLTNKLQKAFLDDYLLGNSLEKYRPMQAVLQLNPVEQALLASRTNHTQLQGLLLDQSQAHSPTPQQSKWLFDAVMRFSQGDSCLPPAEQPVAQPETASEPQPMPETEAMPFADTGEAVPPSAPASQPKSRPYFQQVDSTKEYMETSYIVQPDQVALAFWAQAARTDSALLSETVLNAYTSVTEAVLAVALTDLPWTATHRPFMPMGAGVEMQVTSNCLMLHRDVQAVGEEPSEEIAVAQYYSEPTVSSDSYRPKEFLQGRAYTSQVVLTNMSSRLIHLDLLMQVPQGSIPLASFQTLQVQSVSLPAYSTSAAVITFYFPLAGNFTHSPAWVSIGEKVVKSTIGREIIVKAVETELNLDSFRDIARAGNKTAVLRFLQTKNVNEEELAVDYRELDWLLVDQSFFPLVTEVLRRRLVYVPSVWCFSLLHNTLPELSELLSSTPSISAILGAHFSSQLITTASAFPYREYFPLINARAHSLGSQARITNEQFRDTYGRWLEYMGEKGDMEDGDRLCMAQYMVLQGRFGLASDLVNKVAAGYCPLQRDYLRAYLNVTAAKEVLPGYAAYPILPWRQRFHTINDHILEAETTWRPVDDPIVEVKVVQDTVHILAEGVTTASIRLHPINLEVLFSRSPFLQHDSEASSYTAPVYSQTLNLTASLETIYPLPSTYSRSNQYIVVEVAGQEYTHLYLSSSLHVQSFELQGELKVSNELLKAVAGAYVKVYARKGDGVIGFFKDGYTDIRGRFDYATLSTRELDGVTRFGILVADDTLGATVLEANPPPHSS